MEAVDTAAWRALPDAKNEIETPKSATMTATTTHRIQDVGHMMLAAGCCWRRFFLAEPFPFLPISRAITPAASVRQLSGRRKRS